MGHDKKDISQVNLAGKVALAALGIVQVTLATLAFWDLAHRADEDLRGPKPAWIPVILVNWIGPAVYFVLGVRRDTR
ncbi:membrane protein [Microbacterium sp. CH12i]|uniref:PLDc N-terminal domain-containing protein n=1 Tax=Microbacterium sp. CH12i TaxID=1479651 RepID=UPI000461921F|nr:PLDc N-terminal domain-containing protein [Microbacterium sp. CH12i]KDA05796.1 membrane protein [Microbacterium sp. CH12i]